MIQKLGSLFWFLIHLSLQGLLCLFLFERFPGLQTLFQSKEQFGSTSDLKANSLWKDKDPYSYPKFVSPGSIVKVILKQGIKAEYESEYKATFDTDVKTVPDKKLINDMPAFNTRNTFMRSKVGKSKTQSKILGAMAVVVTSIDPGSGALTLEGQRTFNFGEENVSLRLTGIVSPEDLDKARNVSSDQVANLRLEYKGTLTPKDLKDPNLQVKRIQNPDGTTSVKAELSEQEKQDILMKNIKRVLGESSE